MKDKLSSRMHSCVGSYVLADVGIQIIRRVETRMNEHKDTCRKCAKEKSAIAEHVWDNGHPIL